MSYARHTLSCKIIIGLSVLLIVSGCIKQFQSPPPPEIKPVVLLLTDPQKDFVTTGSRTYDVKGEARGGQAPLKISVGDKITELNQEGPFVFQMQLKPGVNLFTLAVKDAGNATVSRDFTIKAVPVLLKIVIDEIPHQKTAREEIILKGTVQGGWGNTELKINDALIELNNMRQFVYPMKLNEGANKVLISAKDQSGQSALWPGNSPLVIHKIAEQRIKEERIDTPAVQTKTKLEIIARKAGYKDNDKIIFDLKKRELKKLEDIIKKGGKVIVAGKISRKAKPEYLGEIVAMSKTGASRVKAQLRTLHPNISLSLYKEFVITEQ